MKRTVLLGAGASKSYNQSKTGVKMPVAIDFFETFRQLKIAENPWVIIGGIINYIAEKNNSDILDFMHFSEDIEVLHTEIQEKLYDALKEGDFFRQENNILLLRSYNELIFLFVSVINEIQNGKISDPHLNLAKQLNSNDSILTFNWDTLMDRALENETNWNADNGYFIKPTSIYRDKWEKYNNKDNLLDFPKLLKLHGSSNWLTSHFQKSPDGKLELSQETNVEDFYIYEYATNPYSTYAGRFMNGYEPFSYGYYPPNLPLKGKPAPKGHVYVRSKVANPFMPDGVSNDEGLTSMPLIIPPVKSKEYSLFGTLFSDIWREAKKELEFADKIYVIGYSFPKTDIRTDELFKTAFVRRKSIPEIIILNPEPDLIYERFIFDFGIPPEKITIQKDYFNENYKL
jgi:hypothetical protein